MRCKACNSVFTPSSYVCEDEIREEDLCGKCVSAVYDNTYDPGGQPTNLFEELSVELDS